MSKRRSNSQESNSGEDSGQQEIDAKEHISLQVSHYQIENMLEAIPKGALRDDRIWSYYCMAVSSIGILLVFIAAALAISGNILAATGELVAGFIIKALITSVYKVRRDTQERTDNIWNKLLKEKERSRIIELIKETEGES